MFMFPYSLALPVVQVELSLPDSLGFVPCRSLSKDTSARGNGEKAPAAFILFHFSLKDFLSFGMFSLKLCQNEQHPSNSICYCLNNRRKHNILGYIICKICLGLLFEKLKTALPLEIRESRNNIPYAEITFPMQK